MEILRTAMTESLLADRSLLMREEYRMLNTHMARYGSADRNPLYKGDRYGTITIHSFCIPLRGGMRKSYCYHVKDWCADNVLSRYNIQ